MLILHEPSSHPVHTLAFSPDGLSLASVSGRCHHVLLWDLQTRQPAGKLIGHHHRIVSMAFSPSGEHLASVCSTGEVRLWGASLHSDDHAVRSWRCLAQRGWHRTGQQAPARISFSPDGHLLATNFVSLESRGHPLYLGYPEAPRPLWLPPASWATYRLQLLKVPDISSAPGLCLGQGGDVSAIAFSPDGRRLATGSFDRSVHVRSLHSEETLFLNQGMKVHFLAFSPDGRTLASGSPGGLIKIWDALTGSKRATLKGQSKPLHALCYSPDGQLLVTAGGEGTVCFWEMARGTSLSAFDWGIGTVHTVAFAPDGMRAAAGGAGKIVVWDIDWDI